MHGDVNAVEEEREAEPHDQAEGRGQGEPRVVARVLRNRRAGGAQQHEREVDRGLLGEPGLVAAVHEVLVAALEQGDVAVEDAELQFLVRHRIDPRLEIGLLGLVHLLPRLQDRDVRFRHGQARVHFTSQHRAECIQGGVRGDDIG